MTEPFGRYILQKRLALGGMAEIFLAHSASLDGFDKELVIKRILPNLTGDERFCSLFIDEARIVISLSHPNIAQVFDFGQINGAYYLAMEYVDGCDLGTLMELPGVSGRGLDPVIAVHIMLETLKGLDYAHRKTGKTNAPMNLVHRDVSPQNIMVSFDGAVKVMDFGIAQARGRVRHTEPGIVLGKLSYMSPEQATGAVVDHRTDIFSAGVVLWEMLTGCPVYDVPAGPTLYDAIRHAKIVPPSKRNANLSRKLEKIALTALYEDPDQRFPSARAFGEALHQWLISETKNYSPYVLTNFLAERRAKIRKIQQTTPTLPEQTASSPKQPDPPAVHSQVEFSATDLSAANQKLAQRFLTSPNLWLLMRMGENCVQENQLEFATHLYRAAALRFAQRGLLAEALLAIKKIQGFRDFGSIQQYVVALPKLPETQKNIIDDMLFYGVGTYAPFLRTLLGPTPLDNRSQAQGTPLLRALDGSAFADLAQRAPLRQFAADNTIVRQGELGSSMFLIAQGRVLVHAQTNAGEKVYLSSLMSGDFFGENGFFTAAPRSATVEALYPVEAFEIDRELYDRITSGNPQANNILLAFYKERIVETMLARSPIFGILPNDDRRAVIAKFLLREFPINTTIITQGDTSKQIYLIKNGEAEVFTHKGGSPVVLSTLGPGTLFGEVAALRGIARTASVRAKTRLEVLELDAQDFSEILDKKPEVKQLVAQEIGKRVRENLDRLVGFGPSLRS